MMLGAFFIKTDEGKPRLFIIYILVVITDMTMGLLFCR